MCMIMPLPEVGGACQLRGRPFKCDRAGVNDSDSSSQPTDCNHDNNNNNNNITKQFGSSYEFYDLYSVGGRFESRLP
jgi:hypothetical protein